MHKKLILFIIFYYLVTPFVFAKSYLIPTIAQSCKKFNIRPRSYLGIDNKFSLKKHLDQKNTKTCYGHTAYYLLQYLYNTNPNRCGELSLSDVLAQGCDERYVDYGHTFAVLNNIRNKQIALGCGPHIQNIMEFDRKYKNANLCDACSFKQCCCDVKFLTDKNSLDMNQVEKILKSVIDQTDQDKFTHRLLTAIENPKKIETPDYNVYVYEPSNELFQARKKIDPTATQESLVQEEVKKLFSPEPPSTLSYPLEIGLCLESSGSECTGGFHSVVLSAVRESCCADHSLCRPDHDEDWTKEWQVINSYGGADEGWFQSKPLTESMVQFKRQISYVRPCSNSDSDTRSLPKCELHKIFGPFPLHYLAQAGDTRGIELFFKGIKNDKDKKKNLKLTDNFGNTPLQSAVWRDHIEVVKKLISFGAAIDRVDEFGRTALDIATINRNAKMLETLIQAGAQLNVNKGSKYTSLHIAAEDGSVNVMRVLLKYGISHTARIKDGSTALVLAVKENHLDAVKLLLSYGADINASLKNHDTPLFIAFKNGYIEMIKYLLSKKSTNLMAQNFDGNNILNEVVVKGNVELVKILVEEIKRRKMDINLMNQPNKWGWNLLGAAKRQKNHKILNLLLGAGLRNV